tara:strand:- start:253 stop:591 length:339 start_codon:yes stop_codon:yes gene_type:complete
MTLSVCFGLLGLISGPRMGPDKHSSRSGSSLAGFRAIRRSSTLGFNRDLSFTLSKRWRGIYLVYPQNIFPSGRITPKGGRMSLLVAAFGDTVFLYSSGGCPSGKTNKNIIEL